MTPDAKPSLKDAVRELRKNLDEYRKTAVYNICHLARWSEERNVQSGRKSAFVNAIDLIDALMREHGIDQ